MFDDHVTTDDFGDQAQYFTEIHNPLQSDHQNKSVGKDIVYDETITIAKSMSNIRSSIQQGKKVYIQFQCIERPHTGKMFQKDQKVGYEESESANYGGLEYEL